MVCEAAGSVLATSVERARTYVAPHTSATVTVSCPWYTEPGTWENQPSVMQPDGTWKQDPPQWKPGNSVPTYPSGITYLSAVVDNNPPPPAPSGSFG